MYIAIDPDEFVTALETVTTLVDEARLHISEDGISISAVDPANVGMVDLMISEPAFKSLEAEEMTLGVDLSRLVQQVEDIASEPIDADEQTLHIELDEDSQRLSLWANPGSMQFTTNLIDPDSINKEPDLPSVDLPGNATVESSYLNYLVKTAKQYAEHIQIGQSADEDEIYFSISGDLDDWTTAVDADHQAVISLTAANVRSIFSIDYFDDMRKGIPDDVPVSMEIGDSFPIRMNFEMLDGSTDATYMIAPRISSD